MKGKLKKKPGQLFYENMKFLKSKLEGSNILEKEIAMLLICELGYSIIGCE